MADIEDLRTLIVDLKKARKRKIEDMMRAGGVPTPDQVRELAEVQTSIRAVSDVISEG